jgi:hypothetical protein
MGINQTKTTNVGCSNCRSIFIPGVTRNCKECNKLFKRLIHKPIKDKFKNTYDIEFVRNHVIIHHQDRSKARLAARIIIDHLRIKKPIKGEYVKCGDYVITLLKPSASALVPDDEFEQQQHWVGLSFKITPWEEVTTDVLSE